MDSESPNEPIEESLETTEPIEVAEVVEDAEVVDVAEVVESSNVCLLYTSPSPRDLSTSRMPSSA